MRSILHLTVCEKRICKRAIILCFLASNIFFTSFSQTCGVGFTRDTLNWDYIDFLHRSGTTYGGTNPVTSQPFVTNSMAQTQYFTVANNRITFTNTNSLPIGQSGVFYADITTHTGEGGSFGTGEDVKFMPAAATTYSMTFTFQTAVQDVKFSVYDIDLDQRITVTALNGVSPVNITMAKVSGSILTISGSGTTSADAKAAASPGAANNSTDGTANITIPGYVTSFTITVSESTIKTNGPSANQDDGGFYLSDISACFTNPSFPANYYYSYTQPLNGQPAYFLANPQNLHVYMVSNTGTADYLFSDPGITGNKMNSLAYDPVNHWLYYVMDNALAPPGNLTLKKYDFNTGVISTVIADLAAFGIPSFIQGIEYAGAAFYNGSLYLGIEGSDGTSYSTGAESVIWKIDFNGSGVPTSYAQVFGTSGDDGSGNPLHDWGDFIIKDGVIVTHATGPNTTTNHWTHYNLQTGTALKYGGDASTAGQTGQLYDGSIYRVKNDIALYNGSGGTGSGTTITVTSCSPAWIGNAGDASDPFKPQLDFGDAPASYDPVSLSPAANQKACNNSLLRIGSAWDQEWSLTSSSDATADGTDEDGINTVTILNSDGYPYNHVQDVTVLNNTGSTAYLGGWLDYNADGVFAASEGVVVTVPTSASPQTITLAWSGITVASGTPNTFLRVRLYSGVLTTSNATGWLSDGETEDYPVISQSIPLAIQLLDFKATVTKDHKVILNWRAYAENDDRGFEIERSADRQTWEKISSVNINISVLTADYSFLDQQPLQGKSYYRLVMIEQSGSSRYSDAKLVRIDEANPKLNIYPNPARDITTISFDSPGEQSAVLLIRSISGKVTAKRSVLLNAGNNRIHIPTLDMSNGIYTVQISTQANTYTSKLTIAK